MAEYIDRIDFINKLEVINGCVDCNEKCRDCGVNDIKGMLRSIPAADVAPVVHAHWEMKPVDTTPGTYHLKKAFCSNCGKPNKQYRPPYCPHCGAKMDEEEHNNV